MLSFFIAKELSIRKIVAESLAKVTNSFILENTQLGWVSSCCFGYCDKLCDWIKLNAHNMIG